MTIANRPNCLHYDAMQYHSVTSLFKTVGLYGNERDIFRTNPPTYNRFLTNNGDFSHKNP